MSYTETKTVNLVVVTCRHEGCGVVFGMEEGYRDGKIRDRGTFYCPNGHSRWYPGKTAEQLAREATDALARERAAHDQTRAARASAEARELRAKRKLKRVHKGVCPDCNRTFQNLARHMACKHAPKRRRKG